MCIFSVLETGISFAVVGNHRTHRLEIVRRERKCLHLYRYLIHPEFGRMHVRIQSWAPYAIQIYLNGREWLCRQLAKRKVLFALEAPAVMCMASGHACQRLSAGGPDRRTWEQRRSSPASLDPPLPGQGPRARRLNQASVLSMASRTSSTETS